MALQKKDVLSSLRLLVADADPHVAPVLLRTLQNMGFRRVDLVNNGQEALNYVSNHFTDLLITEWQMNPMNGLELISELRTAENSPNRTVPVIMLTARAEKKDVEQARDAGITEFVIKPFTARTVFDRIQQLVDNPRSFVVAPTYVGPERRRRNASVEGNRRKLEPKPAADADLVRHNYFDTPHIIPADFVLRKKIGITGSIASIITPDVLKKAQVTIDSARDDSQKWIKDDIVQLEKQYAFMAEHPSLAVLEKMKELSLSVKSRGGTFGYMLPSNVAQLLYRFLLNHYRPGDAFHDVVVLKHIQALKVVFANAIGGDDSTFATALVNELRELSFRAFSRSV